MLNALTTILALRVLHLLAGFSICGLPDFIGKLPSFRLYDG